MTYPRSFLRRRILLAGSVLPIVALAADPACKVTPWQTKGPFFPESEQGGRDFDLTWVEGQGTRAQGEVIVVAGRVLDAACQPVAGAMIDFWQANRRGRYAHRADRNPAPLDPGFQGAAKLVTDAQGRYAVRTIKPGAYALEYLEDRPREDAGYRTPHLHFRVSKPGYQELATQMYFVGEALNDEDRVLARVPVGDRHVLIRSPGAPAPDDADAAPRYAFDLALAAT